MKMETSKPVGLVISELIFKNLFWYLVFSVIYANTDPTDWWVIKNMWGRIILVFLEMGILASIFNDNEKK